MCAIGQREPTVAPRGHVRLERQPRRPSSRYQAYLTVNVRGTRAVTSDSHCQRPGHPGGDVRLTVNVRGTRAVTSDRSSWFSGGGGLTLRLAVDQKV
jgi:hypothetical protein